MRRRNRSGGYLKWLAAVVVVAAAGGCGVGGGPTGTLPGSDKIELSLALSTNEFVRGDSVVIAVTLRNISSDRVRVNFQTACTLIYGIRRASDNVIVEPAGGTWSCEPEPNHLDLEVDQFFTRTYIWKGVGALADDYLVFGVLGHTMDRVTAAQPLSLLDE